MAEHYIKKLNNNHPGGILYIPCEKCRSVLTVKIEPGQNIKEVSSLIRANEWQYLHEKQRYLCNKCKVKQEKCLTFV